jgi:hypothetical protein
MKLLDQLKLWSARRTLRQERSAFYFDLAMTLHDRVPLFSTFGKYEARARRRTPSMAPVYLHMARSIQRGSLAEAMRGVASPMEMIVLDAVQTGGDEGMAKGLSFLSETVNKTDGMLDAVRKAVTYPVLLLVVFGGMLTGFSKFAVPVLAELMPPEQWPAMGQLLYAMSQFIEHYGHIALVGVLTALGLFIWSLPNWTGPRRVRLDRFVPYSIYRDYQSAILILALASLMQSQVSLNASIERALRFSNPWMRWHLQRVLKRLSKGDSRSFGAAFQTGLLSTALEDRILDASERSDPVAAFVRIGTGSVERTAQELQKSAGVLNLILLTICGLVLGIMMIGFFSTSFALENSIRSATTQSVGR